MVNGACQARRKVYFDIAERQSEQETSTNLVVVTTSPLNPGEVGPIVSPARP